MTSFGIIVVLIIVGVTFVSILQIQNEHKRKMAKINAKRDPLENAEVLRLMVLVEELQQKLNEQAILIDDLRGFGRVDSRMESLNRHQYDPVVDNVIQ
jgi:uncharacterized protein HemX